MASAVEFWQMTPGQVWWLIEDMMPKQALTRPKDMQEVVNMVRRSKAQEKAAK